MSARATAFSRAPRRCPVSGCGASVRMIDDDKAVCDGDTPHYLLLKPVSLDGKWRVATATDALQYRITAHNATGGQQHAVA